MNNQLNKIAVAALVAGLCQFGANASDFNKPISTTLDSAPYISAKALVREDQARMAKYRATYAKYFNQAYRVYPQLPKGILESLAYVASRWEHRTVATNAHTHHNLPASQGLFGLYDTNKAGFTNTLEMVAKHAKLDKNAMLDNVETYILATASFLAHQLTEQKLPEGQKAHTLESIKPLLALMSGLPAGNSNIERYALNSHLFDLYTINQKGLNADGIKIQQRKVQWEKIFSAKELKQLRAPSLIINAKEDKVEATEFEIGNTTSPTIKSADYGPALWVASPNYSSRNGSSITHVAIHTTQGSYAGSISWLANPSSNVSAHYVIRSSDGQVTQMVRNADKAWHARSANPYTIGIEHEGYVSSSSWYTAALYNASASLTKNICSRYPVNCWTGYSGSSHSGTVELSQSYDIKGHQHFPSQSHTDPGIYWSWSTYYTLINYGSSL